MDLGVVIPDDPVETVKYCLDNVVQVAASSVAKEDMKVDFPYTRRARAARLPRCEGRLRHQRFILVTPFRRENPPGLPIEPGPLLTFRRAGDGEPPRI